MLLLLLLQLVLINAPPIVTNVPTANVTYATSAAAIVTRVTVPGVDDDEAIDAAADAGNTEHQHVCSNVSASRREAGHAEVIIRTDDRYI